jgi:outer membrane protein
MNRKNIFRTVIVVSIAALTFTSCNKSGKQNDEAPSLASKAAGTSMKIAYVEVDSLMSQYKFCKDYTLLMTKKSQNIRATLAQKSRALQAAAADFQQKVQANLYTRERAEQIQTALQKQQADLQALQERLSSEFDVEQNKYNNALRDSLQGFLKQYNKSKTYSLILSKAGDNILYADKTYDITSDVVNGLNKRYKPSEEMNVTSGK